MRCETSDGKSCAAQPKPANNENNRIVRLHKVTRNRLNIECCGKVLLKIISQGENQESGHAQPKNLSGAPNLFRTQQCIHRARAKSFQIESYKLESKLLKSAAELSCHFRRHGASHLLPRDLNSGNIAVVAYAELPEPKLP